MERHPTLIQCPICKSGSLDHVEESLWECRSSKMPFKHFLHNYKAPKLKENELGEEPHDGDIDYINIL